MDLNEKLIEKEDNMKDVLDLLDNIDLYTVGRLKTENVHISCGELFNITEQIRRKLKGYENEELYEWFDEVDKPEINKTVVVQFYNGYQESNYFWDGNEWMYSEYGQGEFISFPCEESEYIKFWRYQ